MRDGQLRILQWGDTKGAKMTEQTKSQQHASIDCARCRELLPSYVKSELDNAAADELYPPVARHLAQCPECELAYYRLFRSQGLQRPLAELQQVGQRGPRVAETLRGIVRVPEAQAVDWHEKAVQFGTLWFDGVTGQLRAAQIWLSDLLQPPQLSPALRGMLGEGSGEAGGDALAGMQIAPEEGGFDVALHQRPLPHAGEGRAGAADLEVRVTLHTRFGDYSGVEVTLLGSGAASAKVTDRLGMVIFHAIPETDLEDMQLSFRLPA
jgi:hypothetical protein